MVSVLAFSSEDLSPNPDEVYRFSVKFLLKITKISKKSPGLADLTKLQRSYFVYFLSFPTPIQFYN